MWQRICRAIRNSAPSGTANSKISSCTLNLMSNKAILNDLELLVVFHYFFIFLISSSYRVEIKSVVVHQAL